MDFLCNEVSTSYSLMLAMRESLEEWKYRRGQQEQEITGAFFFSNLMGFLLIF